MTPLDQRLVALLWIVDVETPFMVSTARSAGPNSSMGFARVRAPRAQELAKGKGQAIR